MNTSEVRVLKKSFPQVLERMLISERDASSLNDLLMKIWDISHTTSVPPWLTNGQHFPTYTQVNSLETLKGDWTQVWL